jgi:hypothetical protein
MENWTIGQRVTVDGQSGYIYVIDHAWAGLVLDRNAHKSNAPIFWVKLSELEKD